MAFHSTRTRALVPLLLGLFCAGSALAVPGDLNGNGSVDLDDASIALGMSAGLQDVTGPDLATGDVAPADAPDSEITLLDALRILRAANKLDDLGGGPVVGSTLLYVSEIRTFSADFNKTYALPSGFRLSGTLYDLSNQPNSSSYLTLTNTTIRVPYESSPDANGHYSVVLPNGTYTATLNSSYDVSDSTHPMLSLDAQLPVSPSVTISGADKTQDFKQPPLPATGTISGTAPISGTMMTSSVSADLVGENYASAQGEVQGLNYFIRTLPGSNEVGYSLFDFSDPTAANYLNVTARPAVTVTAGQNTVKNLTAKPLVPISGTITVPAGYGSLQSIELSTADPNIDQYSVSKYAPANNQYQFSLPAGTYDATIALSGNPSYFLNYHTTVTIPSGGGTANITLPSLPATIHFTGKVTDTAGASVAKAVVSVFSQQDTTNGYSIIASAQADASGNFSLTFPKGTYMVYAGPPSS